MPGEPKKKHSKGVKRIRRAAIMVESLAVVICKNCNTKTLAHMACANCGFYGGKSVVDAKQQVKITRA